MSLAANEIQIFIRMGCKMKLSSKELSHFSFDTVSFNLGYGFMPILLT